MQPSRPVHSGHRKQPRRFHVGHLSARGADKRATAFRQAQTLADRHGEVIRVFDHGTGKFSKVEPRRRVCPNPLCQAELTPGEFAIAREAGNCSSCGAGPEERNDE